MPNRQTHNFFSKLLHPEYNESLIDDTNKRIDAPSQIYPGMPHRNFFHNTDPVSKDAMEIHQGDIRKYMINIEHIILDSDPALQQSVKILEILDGNSRGNKRYRNGPKNGKRSSRSR